MGSNKCFYISFTSKKLKMEDKVFVIKPENKYKIIMCKKTKATFIFYINISYLRTSYNKYGSIFLLSKDFTNLHFFSH